MDDEEMKMLSERCERLDRAFDFLCKKETDPKVWITVISIFLKGIFKCEDNPQGAKDCFIRLLNEEFEVKDD
jgi:hypothetical protein